MSSRKTTLADIARDTGFSQATISLILNKNKSYSFSAETIAKVRDSCDRLGYVNRLSTVLPGVGEVMIIASTLMNPYYMNTAQDLTMLIREAGMTPLICNTYRNREAEYDILRAAMASRVKGIVYLACPLCVEMVNEIAKTIPVVSICDRTPDLSIDIVEMNNQVIASLIVEHLVTLGHRNIMMVTPTPEISQGRQIRIEAVRSNMRKYGLEDSFFLNVRKADPLDKSDIHYDDYMIGYEAMQDPEIFRSDVTAFIGMNDMIARGITDALVEKEICVPGDYSVCGCDNLIFSKMLPLSITTVDTHITQKSHSAFSLLKQKMQLLSSGEIDDLRNVRHVIELPPVLIRRRSTGVCQRTEVLKVQKA